VPADLPPYLQQLFDLPLLNARGRVALFRQMNYLRFKAERLRLQIEPERTTAAELDRIDALLAQADRVRKQLIEANLRLVVSIAKRHMTPALDFFEIISDRNVSMMRAVEKFDYSRGFKFSTYASWAIIRNFARQIPEQRYHRDRYQTGRDELLECVAEPHWDDPREDDQSVAIRGTVERMLGHARSAREPHPAATLRLDTAGQPQTLEQIGRRLGVSKERIRQLETGRWARLRLDFESDVEALLGS
jgi:RNA polymerase primary sigma factor